MQNLFIEHGDLSMLEEMAENKESIMNEVEEAEQAFEMLYNEVKPSLTSKIYIAKLQENIREVLRLKDSVIRLEHTNMELMEKDLKAKLGKLNVKKSAQDVVNRYKRASF